MNERTGAQLRVIKTVTNVLRAVDISAWLFGGWGLDARIGRITRDHGDIEFWLERVDAERSKTVLIGAGATALAPQPPEEACEFIWDGVEFSTAYFDRQPDGLFSQPQGRWSDWLFPPGSFGKEPGTLDGTPVRFSTPLAARAHGIETVYQDLAMIGDLSVYHNMFLGRERRKRFLGLNLLDNAKMRFIAAA